MKYYDITPESVGGHGPGSVINKSNPAKIVTTALEYCFEFFPTDDVIYCPWAICMVTDKVAAALDASALTGYRVETAKFCIEEQAYMWWKNKPEDMPHFVWLTLNGEAFKDDFGTPDGVRIIVSERALKFLDKFSIANMKTIEAEPLE